MNREGSRTLYSILNTVTSVVGQFLKLILQFVTRTVFIYTLGKAYLGINGLFSDILSMLSLTELGFDTAINFQLYKPLAEKDDKRVRILMKFYKQAYRVIGFVILGLGICLIPTLPFLIRDYDSLASLGINATLIFLLYLMQNVSTYLFFAYRSAVVKADQKKYLLDIADYAVTLAGNIAQILILIFLRDFVIYTAVLIVFFILKNLVEATIATHYYPQFFTKEEESLSREEVRGLFKDCGALFVYKVNGVVLKATDNIVLSTFMGLAIVGLYSNYLLFYTTIKSLMNQIYTAIKASTGNLFATSSMDKKYQFFCVMNYLTIILYGTAAVGVSVCGDELIRTWISDEYVIAQPFAILIGIEILFYGIQTNLGQIRNVTGVFRQMWYRPLIGIIINIVISVWMVQVCGIYGVILGTISASLLSNFIVDPSVIYKYGFKNYRHVSEYYKVNCLYFAILIFVGVLDFFLCRVFYTGHGWLSVLLHIMIVAVSVPGIFVIVCWRTEECKYMINLVKKVLLKIVKVNGR